MTELHLSFSLVVYIYATRCTLCIKCTCTLQLQLRDYINCNWKNKQITLLQPVMNRLQLRPTWLQLDTNQLQLRPMPIATGHEHVATGREPLQLDTIQLQLELLQ